VSEPINIRALATGTRIRRTDGSIAEIVANPADGVWLFARFVSADDAARVGEDEMVFAQDVVEVVPAHSISGDTSRAL
jgi:hypothetical protein